MITENTLSRWKRDAEMYAGEDVSVEYANGYLYTYGSELGVLRIANTFASAIARGDAIVRKVHSINAWRFELKIRFLEASNNGN